MFCLYPGLAQRIFQIFRCTTVTFYPEKVQYMSNDFNVRCYGDEHTYASHVAIVFMVLFVLGIPAFMFTTLCSHSYAEAQAYADIYKYSHGGPFPHVTPNGHPFPGSETLGVAKQWYAPITGIWIRSNVGRQSRVSVCLV